MRRSLYLGITSVALVAAGCGDPTQRSVEPGPSSVVAVPDAPQISSADPNQPPPTTFELTSNENGVAVIVRGRWTAATGICPVEQPNCPHGIALEGDMGGLGDGIPIQAIGWYDGGRVMLATVPVVWDDYVEPTFDFDSACPEKRNAGDQSAVGAAANAYVQQHLDEFDVVWIDNTNNVLTFRFVGNEVDAHRSGIEALVGDAQVCVIGGARFSQSEMEQASSAVSALQTDGVIQVQGGFGTHALRNRLPVPIEVLTPSSRRAMEAIGEMVEPLPFIELLDSEADALPPLISVVKGTVDLLTARVRSSGGMAALGMFTVQYDAELNCVYFSVEGQPGRTVPVWPFGYAAAGNPVTVFDATGAKVTTVGEEFSSGGGFGGPPQAQYVLGDNMCGATEAFYVNR